MWELINTMPVDKDYLQVFSLSEANGRQRIKHTQEEPEYYKEYVFDIDIPITEKIFVWGFLLLQKRIIKTVNMRSYVDLD